MSKRFHGIDLHKRYATISVRNEKGEEINLINRCYKFSDYIHNLGPKDEVVIEALTGAFFWSDQIEKQKAKCVIINPRRFKIIRESWTKTDKRDAVNLSLALWMSSTANQFKLPLVDKPSITIRELRKLFNHYQAIKKHITQCKNQIQAVFVDQGMSITNKQREQLFNGKYSGEAFTEYKLTEVNSLCIKMNLDLLDTLNKQKANLLDEIQKRSDNFKDEIKLLISIRGVTVFLALAFLSDISNIARFKSLRKFNAYLGVVPEVKSSGGKTIMGHIIRQSRNLSRTLFTQAIPHLAAASPVFSKFYKGIVNRKGYGKGRIALLRKLFGVMRRMLLDKKPFKFIEKELYERKMMSFLKMCINFKKIA